jgi:lipoate-protein ligase A
MAVDEALLAGADEHGLATLRFYQWSEPTLSLGYFQRYADRNGHTASRHCAVVRRQTGGGAILHDRELTYSLTLPAGHLLARQTQDLYAAVHDAFIAAIQPLLRTAATVSTLLRRDQETAAEANPEPFLCFERQAPGDVLLVPGNAERAWKILGSAQRRHHGAVLQHGSLLLERSPAAPELLGLRDLTQVEIGPTQITRDVSTRLGSVFGMRFTESPIPPHLESIATELANIKYGSWGWTNRR